MGAPSRPRRWHRLRAFFAGQVEIHERLILINRPWQEDRLHWSGDGAHAQLHGTVPPSGRNQESVTTGGWCPGLRHDKQLAPLADEPDGLRAAGAV